MVAVDGLQRQPGGLGFRGNPAFAGLARLQVSEFVVVTARVVRGKGVLAFEIAAEFYLPVFAGEALDPVSAEPFVVGTQAMRLSEEHGFFGVVAVQVKDTGDGASSASLAGIVAEAGAGVGASSPDVASAISDVSGGDLGDGAFRVCGQHGCCFGLRLRDPVLADEGAHKAEVMVFRSWLSCKGFAEAGFSGLVVAGGELRVALPVRGVVHGAGVGCRGVGGRRGLRGRGSLRGDRGAQERSQADE